MNRSVLVGRNILFVAALQLLGYLALSALVPHSDFATFVGPLRSVPTVLLLAVAVLAVPAVALAIALGAVLSALGVRPTPLLVVVAVFAVSVASLWVYRRLSDPGDRRGSNR